MIDKTFTVNEVAEIFKISAQTVRKWIKNEYIYAYMISGRKCGYRIPLREIERLQRM